MELSQQMLAIGSVLGLLACAIALARNRGWIRRPLSDGPRPAGGLKRLDRLVLTPQHTVQLIRSGNGTLLIATHPGGIEWMVAPGAEVEPGARLTASAASKGGPP